MAIHSADALAQIILDCQLLEPAQTRELTRSLKGRFQEPKALARDLLKRGWLTTYQVNHLFQGRARDLLLGPYVIEERLGEGGMGHVFRARHKMLNRRVALKVIRKERLANPDFVRRFYREIQAAAQLSHPNIVVAYDADHVGDTHFFAMEYVNGVDLCQLVHDKGPLPIATACDFIRQAALGLQHAFEHGMVHRDVKPSNLLVTRSADRKKARGAGADGSAIIDGEDKPVVKILDMGLVRVKGPVSAGDQQSGDITQVQNILGTPDFIAPEQARDAHAADIRADLYSLGCTFYYLLAGQVPFPGDVAMEKLIKHSMEEPRPIGELRPETPPAVTAIVRKLMAKQPEDRFQTPAELAVALATLDRPSPRQVNPDVPSEEFISLGTPATQAREADTAVGPLTRADSVNAVRPEPTRKTDAEKRRWLLINVGGGAFLFFLLLVLVVAVIRVWPSGSHGPAPTGQPPPEERAEAAFQALREQSEDANAEPDAVRRQVLAFRMTYPGTPQAVQALGFLRKLRSPLDRLANKDIPQAERGDWQPPELVAILGERRLRQSGVVQGVALSADGALVLSGGDDGVLYGRDAMTGQTRFALKRNRAPITCVAVNADGTLAATAGTDGMVNLWDVKDGRASKEFQAHMAAIWCMAFSHDGKTLATGSEDKTAKLWDVAKEKELFKSPDHAGAVRSISFSADDTKLATVTPGDVVHLWDVAKGSALPALPEAVGKALTANFAPAGSALAIGCEAGNVKLWDVDGGKEQATLAAPPQGPFAFAAKGALLAVAQGDTVQLWDVAAKNMKATLPAAPRARAVCMATDRDGSRLAVGDDQGGVRVFDPVTLREQIGATERWTSGTFLAFSPTDKLLAASTTDSLGRAWEADTGKERPLLPAQAAMNAAAFSPDGQSLLVAAEDASVRVWDVANNRETAGLHNHITGVISVAVSPDGSTAASGSRDGFIIIWDLAKGQKRTHMLHRTGASVFPVTALAFSPDGKTLASASKEAVAEKNVPTKDKTVKLWNVEAGGKARELKGHTLGVTSLAWSPDGKTIAAAGEDRTIQIWDAVTLKLLPPVATNASPAISLIHNPESGELLAAGQDGKLIFWNPSTAKSMREWQFPGPIQGMSLTVDGRHLAVSCGGSVYLFRLPPAAK
jgi:WD40 repeat protein/serine/threonine protein kinase